MLDADRPILTHDQDRLGRAPFAKSLARSILDRTSPESLVIGLYGGWGSGKTSIVNLTLEELHYASTNMFDNERPIVLNFDPWSYTGQHNLIHSFLRRLAEEMRAAEYFQNKEDILYLLELYLSFFTKEQLTVVHRAKRKEWLSAEARRDLTLVKIELNKLLRAEKHKVVIFIDNLSRLYDAEINTMLQIIKSIADFDQTVYVLAIDKTYLVNVLNKIHQHEGDAFVEKIVQLPFDIPPIAEQDVEVLLLDRLKDLVDTVPKEKWEMHYWSDVYFSSLRFFFTSCRDITRYVNTVSFSYPFLKDLVNPVDLFAITAVQVFEPDVFNGIRENKDLFADLAEHVLQFDDKTLNEDKIRLDEILDRSKNTPRKILVQLLIRLFPRLRRVYDSHRAFHHNEAIARKNKRICTYDLFDLYFRLSIASDSFSEEEMNSVLSLAPDEQGFALALLRLNQDNRIQKFLDVVESKGIFTIKKEHIGNIITALIDSGDLFPEGELTLLELNTPMRMHRIFYQLFRRVENRQHRYSLFSTAILKSVNSIYSVVHEITEEEKEHLESEDTFAPESERNFSENELLELKKLAVLKIILWADNGRLIEHPQLIALLKAWKNWGDGTQTEAYVEKVIKDDRNFIAFLCAALREPIRDAMKKEEKNPAWIEYLKNISDFIPLDMITPRATELFKDNHFDKLRETEQLSLMIYLDLVKPETVKFRG